MWTTVFGDEEEKSESHTDSEAKTDQDSDYIQSLYFVLNYSV